MYIGDVKARENCKASTECVQRHGVPTFQEDRPPVPAPLQLPSHTSLKPQLIRAPRIRGLESLFSQHARDGFVYWLEKEKRHCGQFNSCVDAPSPPAWCLCPCLFSFRKQGASVITRELYIFQCTCMPTSKDDKQGTEITKYGLLPLGAPRQKFWVGQISIPRLSFSTQDSK